jgi:tripartite-type tricarboxylate transporter receptor subunit TctC
MHNTIPGLNIHGCWNMVLPKNTPEEVQTWYREHFVPAIRSNQAQEKFAENMMFTTPKEHSPEGMRAAMARLKQTWQPIARKIKP